jgi:meiosis-specific transcription factor NDT80
MTSLGRLSYGDASNTPIKVDISGIIDKGFFIAESEWTCYRRNYFSCVCSFSLTPMMHNTPIHFHPTGSTQAYNVYGFAMCISAVVSDNDSHTIDLVQHTPKRDKGPIAKPEKVRLSPKPPQASHHPLSNLYAGPDGTLGSSRYEQQGFGQPTQQGSAPTEHTFERIQFKQATANNGKRRAAQQYYHLIVELWADVGQQGGSEQWVKVAYRKSAKMIVRGRSPGHYQSERRGSTSSGPGGSGGGSIGGGGYSSGVLGPSDYSGSSSMLGGGGGYGQHYDVRHSSYGGGGAGGTRHHHELAMEPMISAEEVKAITDTKGYQYYPATIYEGEQQDTRQQHHHHHHHHSQPQQHQQQVELFSHSGRHDSESGSSNSMSTTFDPTKGVKSEMENNNGLPSLFYHSGPYYGQRCGRFEGKTSSTGQYPTLLQPPSTTMSMT